MPSGPGRQPLAVAYEWVAKITTVGAEMVLPAVAGHFADRQLGTRFLVVVGVVFGFVLGLWHLIKMTTKPPDEIDQSPRP